MSPEDLELVKSKYPVSASTIRANSGGAAPEERHHVEEQEATSPAGGTSDPKRASEDQRGLPGPESELIICGESEEALRDQTVGSRRYTVRNESRRRRLLDPDNLVGGVKFFLDALRKYRVIPDDTSKVIRLIVFQTKVGTDTKEETIIEVIPPVTTK